jgi:hypothetical protein
MVSGIFNNKSRREFVAKFGIDELAAFYIYRRYLINHVKYDDFLLLMFHLKNFNPFSSSNSLFNVCYRTYYFRFYSTLRKLNTLLPDFNFRNRFKNIENKKVALTIVDATEININKPTYYESFFYSGKKKKHNIKFQIIIDSYDGEILHASSVSWFST